MNEKYKLINVDINNLYCVLVYKIKGQIVLDIEKEKIIKYNLYPNIKNKQNIEHILCKVCDSPHFDFVIDKKKRYISYMERSDIYAGYGIEHSPTIYEKLIKNFKNYLEYPYENKYILCFFRYDKYIIINGLHRCCIMLNKNKNIKYIDIKLNLL